ncbi:glyoxylase-like metal-dependent hydrolase (beta-lactamase superfamily II)/rhodanese-related sulfurtransferase [Lewinella marina]|uniref:MBL fold metallo-hydrolase n=1 Tax=Neolewinella marina TaxID=438751 RepID=A0A2G0CBS7_9BACT|nr:MBL fold metallo-hydrolase [Neolewinella marina]NJB87048.1 glyoxylase-like metal-dependent hydrolase (beta-lactamase superfamily II)/rhodanese-related sulfurtransferase [Neolewinella marina]PHK97416.1 MBL fold metallo-hydrolase [Neolewinella marina]
MTIEQIYTGCLAQGAYYIASNGEAAIVDPLRSPAPYLQKAQEAGDTIKYIFETHFHADFVSGHIDLAKETGAKIVYGPGAKTDYEKYEATDGEEFKLGELTIRALHTPGHTLESTTYLLLDKTGKPHAIFSGDTLFIGDVGRPDLAQKKGALTTEDLAGLLYDSLRRKIMVLPDDVIVYPAHGAGSACGKKMSRETTDTLGNQKATNYALREDMTREEFVKEVTEGLAAPPAYFSENVRLNKAGYDSFDEVMNRGAVALSPEQFEEVANQEMALILDVRSKEEFVKGFIPNSIFVGLDGSFAPWVGELVPDLQQPILVVTDPGREAETVERLSRVGYDNTLGYLDGGIRAWKSYGGEIDTIETISADEFVPGDAEAILDVRKESEYAGGHLREARNLPLSKLTTHTNQLDQQQCYHLHCGSGYRSTIASSILKARGFDRLVNVQDKVADILSRESVDA